MELLGFIAAFLAAGAVGFRLSALRGLLGSAPSEERDLARVAARRAALLGLLGAVLGAVLFARDLPELAERRHLAVAALLAQPLFASRIVLMALAVAGFVMAAAGLAPGWTLAALGVLLAPVRGVFLGQFARAVNPVHELAGGLWIGTLFVLIAVGITPVLRAPIAAERRGALAARLVNGFSPLALGSAALLAVLGVVTAWQHLKKLSALWTTPYGYALIAKLCVVAAVVALGAWNWRRQRPRMGSEAGAIALSRSATAELALAGVVLLITSVLVSLPSPD
jgi:putative copper export protein